MCQSKKKHRKFDYQPQKKRKYFLFVCIYIFFAPCQVPLKLTHYVYVLDANRNGQRTFTHGWPKGQKSNFATSISWGSPFRMVEANDFIAHQVVFSGIALEYPYPPLVTKFWPRFLIADMDSILHALHANS